MSPGRPPRGRDNPGPNDNLRARIERAASESAREPRGVRPGKRPPLRVFTSTLWEYPSQHYDSPSGAKFQGSKDYVGATPSWIIWQLLSRYTRPGDTVLDPMCGSGTTIDVCADLDRSPLAFDLAPSRPDITQADARALPLESESVDFAFIDPPYSTHVDYSSDPACIGKLDAGEHGRAPSDPTGASYYEAMEQVIAELHRVLKDRRYLGLYVSDSFRKEKGRKGGQFMPIGFELFSIMRRLFRPVDIISVVRHNKKLTRANWHKAAEDGAYFLRGFNYLFIMKKEDDA